MGKTIKLAGHSYYIPMSLSTVTSHPDNGDTPNNQMLKEAVQLDWN